MEEGGEVDIDRTSVILHGLGESGAADTAERREADQVRVADIFPQSPNCGE